MRPRRDFRKDFNYEVLMKKIIKISEDVYKTHIDETMTSEYSIFTIEYSDGSSITRSKLLSDEEHNFYANNMEQPQ